jgi:hypothetical protein
MITIYVKDQLFNILFVELICFKKRVNNMGIKVHNNLPSYLMNLNNIHIFYEIKTFYSVEEYLSYKFLSWKM